MAQGIGSSSSGGGGTPTFFVGALSNTSNAYSITTTPSSGWALAAGYAVKAFVSAVNTGAATLAVNGGSALPIVNTSFAALTGGEMSPAAIPDEFVYSTSASGSCANSCYILVTVPPAAVVPGGTQTITQAEWAAAAVLQPTSAGQTYTLPSSGSTALSLQGGLLISASQFGVTLTASGSDTITSNGATTAAAGSILIPVGSFAVVTQSSAGAWQVSGTPNGLIPTPIVSDWFTLYLPSVSTATSSASAATTTVYCGGGVAGKTMTVSTLGVTVIGTGTTNLQLALYASGAWGRPGALMSNTGNILDTSAATVTGALAANQQIEARAFYWLCIQVDDTSATWRGYSASARSGSAVYGSATIGNILGSSSVDGFSATGSAFGTWGNFTSGTTWTDDTGNRAPFVAMEAASVP